MKSSLLSEQYRLLVLLTTIKSSGGQQVRGRQFEYQLRPVIIGNSTFIGANSLIMGGEKIGTFAAIGANSFILHDIADNTIAYGNPCQEHGERISSTEYNRYKF